MIVKLKPGDKAPELHGSDQDGKPVSLQEYAGKKLVLYFYPKDDTPGCTAEACNLKDNFDKLRLAGYEILGVSVDNEKSHQKFISKYQLPFRLLADVDKKTVEAYGVWVEKNMYGKKYFGTARVTFIIDEQGIISRIIDKVDTKNHTEQIFQSDAKK